MKQKRFNMKTKVCTKCGKEKKLKEFNKQNVNKDGLSYWCKICIKQYKQIYYKQNKIKIQKKNKKWGLNNKEKIKQQHKKYKELYPWGKIFIDIKYRCKNKNDSYFKKGIKCLITKDEVKHLWFRDKAWLLKQPSIDREDNDGHYTFDNCQFIELSENSAKDKRKPILQFDLKGNFIKEWKSQTEAFKVLKIQQSNINAVLKGKYKTAGSFKWKYKKKRK
jgi:hypothetical protein